MYSVDITTNPNYYIVKKDGKEVFKISKSNDFEKVKKFLKDVFKIEVVEK